jgi:hypothetical protein
MMPDKGIELNQKHYITLNNPKNLYTTAVGAVQITFKPAPDSGKNNLCVRYFNR